jgi:ornithine cyclodeaminase
VTTILRDSDIDLTSAMAIALEAVEDGLRAKVAGRLVAPPRHAVSYPSYGDLVFTIGGTIGSAAVAGFRVYDTFEGSEHDQIVAVWSAETAKLRGIVVGNLLGEIRTGAIGGIAIRHMSAPDASTVGVIGTGMQARTQLLAAAAVRSIRSVRVFSRDAAKRETFAEEMSSLMGCAVESVSSAKSAATDADVVICATTSTLPVVEAGWIKPGAHVTTVGPKSQGAHELGLDIAARAETIATDSPDQIHAYRTPFFLTGTPHGDRMVDLARIVGGLAIARPNGGETTLFCSTGLAGTEVLVAARLLDDALG